MTDVERVDTATAVSEALADGHCVYLAGFSHLIPFATGHEIARQDIADLDLVRMAPDLLCDQLIAAGCASKLRFSWAGNPGLGTLRAFRRAVEDDVPRPLAVEEYTHFGLNARLAAGAKGFPFLPLRTFAGSNLPEHTDAIRSVEHPYEDGEVFVVPPLEPDVALVHAQRADAVGNAHVEGIVGDIVEAVFAAETVVLSVEEIVSEERIRNDSNHTIPGTEIDYLVEEPFGASPSYAQGYYNRDNGAYRKWDAVARSHDSTVAWLDEWIYGVRDRAAYLDALGERRPESVSPERSRAEPVAEDDR